MNNAIKIDFTELKNKPIFIYRSARDLVDWIRVHAITDMNAVVVACEDYGPMRQIAEGAMLFMGNPDGSPQKHFGEEHVRIGTERLRAVREARALRINLNQGD